MGVRLRRLGLGTPRKAGGSRWKRKESEVGLRENQDFWGDGGAKNWKLRDAPFLASFKLVCYEGRAWCWEENPG